AVGEPAELELGVGDDYAAREPVFGGLGIHRQGHLAQLLGGFPADPAGRLLEIDVDVVPALFLGGRREDRLGELVALAQAGGQADAADGLRLPILLPAGAGQVPAGDAFDR